MRNEFIINKIVATLKKVALLNEEDVNAPKIEIDINKLIPMVMAEAMCSRRTALEYIKIAREKYNRLQSERD